MSTVFATLGRVLQRGQISQAIYISILSKCFSFFALFVVIPLIAIRAGSHEFGIYTLYLSVAAFAGLVDGGFGSTITRTVANRGVAGALKLVREAEKIYLPASAVTFCVAAGVLYSRLTGSQSEHVDTVTISFLYVSLLAQCSMITLLPWARALVGLGEVARQSLYQASAAIVSFIVLVSAVFIGEISNCELLISAQLIALGLPLFLARRRVLKVCENTIIHYDKSDRMLLLSDGFTQIRLNLFATLQRELPKWGLIGIFATNDLGRLGLFQTVLTGMGGLVGTFTQAVWPNISIAHGQGDLTWIRDAIRSLRIVGLLFLVASWALCSIFPLILMTSFGASLNKYGLNIEEVSAFGLFSVAIIWDHINFMIMTALGRLRTILRITIAQFVVTIALWLLFPASWPTLIRYFLAECASLFVVGSIVYYIKINAELKQCKN